MHIIEVESNDKSVLLVVGQGSPEIDVETSREYTVDFNATRILTCAQKKHYNVSAPTVLSRAHSTLPPVTDLAE